MSRVKRIEMTREPVLKIHNWVVKVLVGGKCKVRYCMDRRAVQAIKDMAKPGTRIQVFRAVHNFKEAFAK